MGPEVSIALELIGASALVLAMFRARTRIGLAPLYLALGVFQPLQVGLATVVYLQVGGVTLSPGSVLFAVSLMAILLVYIREDVLQVRNFVVAVLAANAVMSLILALTSTQLHASAAGAQVVPPSLFDESARVALAGTVMLAVDVPVLLLIYGGIGRLFRNAPLFRAAITLTAVLLFDGAAFAAAAFSERPDFVALLNASLASKIVLAVILSFILVVYLRFIEPAVPRRANAGAGIRDVFHAFTYRDRFEAEERRNATLRAEREQMYSRITDGFVAIDSDWRYTHVNPRAAAIVGQPAERLLGRRVWEAFPEIAGTPFEAAYRTAMRTQQPVNFEAFYPPFARWFECNVYPSPEGITTYFRDVTERVEHQRDAVRRATQDDLTGLLSRNGARNAIEEIIAQAHPGSARFGVVMLSIDRLYQVNSSLGYAAGDQVLTIAAERLRTLATNHGCALARTGAASFVLVSGWHDRADDIGDIGLLGAELLQQPFQLREQSVYLTSSTGIALYPDAGADPGTLLKNAELAANAARRTGRNRTAIHTVEQEDWLRDRIALTADLREAQPRGELSLVYQPIVDGDGRVAALEALLRWHSPTRGAVSPAEFIPSAEDSGLIVEIGSWVLSTALEQQRAWLARGIDAVPLAVNISSAQLERPQFADEVQAALELAGVSPGLLKLEITESVFVKDDPAIVATLHALRALGVRISLDDFGTGYSNLGNLRRLPLDEIKIDRSFVKGLPEDGFSETLCRVIVTMSRLMQFSVVAEGVESAEQAGSLRGLGCHLQQGYLHARPMPPDHVEALLRARIA